MMLNQKTIVTLTGILASAYLSACKPQEATRTIDARIDGGTEITAVPFKEMYARTEIDRQIDEENKEWDKKQEEYDRKNREFERWSRIEYLLGEDAQLKRELKRCSDKYKELLGLCSSTQSLHVEVQCRDAVPGPGKGKKSDWLTCYDQVQKEANQSCRKPAEEITDSCYDQQREKARTRIAQKYDSKDGGI